MPQERQGLTFRSTTGIWVIVSGPVIVGPFDGRSAAQRELAGLRRQVPTVKAHLQRVFAPTEARTWASRLRTTS